MNGSDLKVLRKKLGLSQEELGELVGLSKNTIYNYENSGVVPKSKIPIFKKIFKENNVDSNSELRSISEKEALDVIEKILLHEKELMKYENFYLWVKSLRTDERNKTLKEVLKNRLDNLD
ncbi:helix-turn-helix domain-containing protein [Tenacibaculum sp. SDUM215027]|uniref:helix-turn-helix domain-containing protein n=1 Tax=Tenacibaculum sp. SDUM215027 TaxID=3422596 RepID=UPI003D32359D